MIIFDLFTWMIVTTFFISSIYKFAKGKRNIMIFVFWEFYIFFGLPILLNAISPVNYPSIMRGFILSSNNSITNVLTNAFIIYCCIVFHLWGFGKEKQYLNMQLNMKMKDYIVLWTVILGAILAVTLSGDYGNFKLYGAVASSNYTGTVSEMYSNVFTMSFFSVIAMGIYIIVRPRIKLLEAIVLFLIAFINIYLNGKRNIVAITIIVILTALYYKRRISKRQLALFGIISISLLVLYTVFYQVNLRGFSLDDAGRLLTNIYIDNGRVDRIKMAVYSMIHPDELKILDFPGQSILFKLMFFIPRSIWPGKPYPYYHYFTYKLIVPGTYSAPDSVLTNLGWGMTTSWFDEAVANFAWLGLIIAPFVICILCRYADRSINVVKWLTLFIVLQMVRTDLNHLQMYMWIMCSLYFNRRAHISEAQLKRQETVGILHGVLVNRLESENLRC